MSPSEADVPDETSPLLTTTTPGPATIVAPAASAPAHPERENGTTQSNGDVQETAKKPNMALIFPAITIGMFLAAADGTIALVSYATISSELDALNRASWIMTAYGLALASFQPLYGKLCDIFGRKECLLVAYSLFALGCLACGFANSIEQLIAARVLQAIGGGGLGTVVSILLTGLVSKEDRGIWQGVLNIVYALGAGLGAPLGGFLAGSVGWRWSFFGQVPFCLLAIVLVSLFIDGEMVRAKGQNEQQTLVSKLRRVDFLGSVILITMTATFIFGLDRGSNESWIIPETYVPFIISVVAALWFFYVETRIAREPIVPPALVFSAKITPIYITAFFEFVAIMALDFILPLYYQARRQFTPQQASFYMLPAIIAGVVSALLTGFWMRRSGQYYWALILASVLHITGSLGNFLLSGPVLESTAGLVTFQVVTELGLGNAVVSGLIAVISNSSDSGVAILTAIYYSIRNLGCVIGVSIVSTIIQQALRELLVIELLPYDVDIDEIVDEVRRSIDSLKTLDPKIAAIVRDCYGQAINRGFLFILIMAFLAIIPAFMIQGGKGKRHEDKQNTDGVQSEA